MKLKDILVGAGIAAIVCVAASPISAQTKAETKLYNTAIIVHSSFMYNTGNYLNNKYIT